MSRLNETMKYRLRRAAKAMFAETVNDYFEGTTAKAEGLNEDEFDFLITFAREFAKSISPRKEVKLRGTIQGHLTAFGVPLKKGNEND